ncbi:MAG: helix-turn-helix transcriptional regulator [Planctomycetota bacterium]|nr:helix-turn-helix transcriptional regulator [Planctomycetota bacterium]
MAKTIRKKKKSKVRTVPQHATSPRFILLGNPDTWSNQFFKHRYVVCRTLVQIDDVARRANKDSLWITSRSEMIDTLIRAMGRYTVARFGRRTHLGDLLMLHAPRAKTLAILHGYFRSVVGVDSSFKSLPRDQLAEVLLAPKDQRRDLFIGGVLDPKSKALALVRGDLSRIVVPLTIFKASGASKPDFGEFEVEDYGQTIRFGNYEVAADFVLYALDPRYRTRINAKRRAQDKGFGPSLRRIRTLRKIGRDAFDGVAAKTIARIERGKVQKPRGKTLRVICEVLGVEAEEIESY